MKDEAEARSPNRSVDRNRLSSSSNEGLGATKAVANPLKAQYPIIESKAKQRF
jgi:hypothetical protein